MLYNQKKIFIFSCIFVSVSYFILTTVIYFISIKMGQQGITIPLFNGVDDGIYYWDWALKASQGLLGRDETRFNAYVVGMFMKYTGLSNPYIFRIFNQIGFMLLIYFSFMLIDMQAGAESKNYAPKTLLLYCFLFYASLVLNVNLSIYRDIWIYMFFTASVAYAVKIIYKQKYRFITLFFIMLWLLYNLRPYAAFSVLLSLALHFFIFFADKRMNNKILIVFILCITTIFAVVYYTFFIDYRMPIVNLTLREGLKYRAYVAFGESQMGIGLDQPNVFLFLLNYAYSFVGNMIGPLPWHISGWSTCLVFFVETVPMVYIIHSLFILRSTFSNIQKYLLLNALIWISLIAITNDNIGTGTRLRVLTWVMLMIVFVVIKMNAYKERGKCPCIKKL